MTAVEQVPDDGVVVTEIRVLEGPNLYFPRAAIKVILDLPAYLAADQADIERLAHTLNLRRGAFGAADTDARQRAVMRIVERVLRSLARESGTSRLGVRVRPGGSRSEVVVAYPWRSRTRGRAMAERLQPLLRRLLVGELGADHVAALGQEIRALPAGDAPPLTRPRVPVASITGTNGKTTTTRLLAHMGMTAGLRTGWSSTDGVLVQGELIEPGDYSGPAGARAVLDSPGVQLAVLETARGGMLFKGLGVPQNDVSIVTNVSADHLGVQGIETVDQLAEVKAIITKVTKPDGWAVLNGEDPRVWAMRTGIRARPWCFALNPDSPALRESLDAGGRGITVLDGDIVVLRPGEDPQRLISTLDVPVTLSGLSEHNIANALAAAAGGLGIGLDAEAVVEGLRTFAPDPAHNPGRLNTYTLSLASGGAATVILDMAHNEAGLDALLRVSTGLRPPGAQLLLGLGTGGDRTDEILENMGEMAGLRADQVQIVHKEHYLRGRTMTELEDFLRRGLGRSGVTPTASWETEMQGLQGLLDAARDGDVVTLMTHSHWSQLNAWLGRHGGIADDAAAVRRKVVGARGEHELEAEIAALWQDEDADRRIERARALLEGHPGDPRLLYEYAGTFDSAGREPEALEGYDRSLAAGLRPPYRSRALIQKASTLRHLGRYEESLAILDQLAQDRPGSTALTVFRALVLHDMGRDATALHQVLDVLMQHSGEPDLERYRRSLTRFVSELGPAAG